MRITADVERFPIAGGFRISRGSKSVAEVVVATIERDGRVGRGECVPYARYGETIDQTLAAIRGCSARDRDELQRMLPPGAARNALDCAFWDLERGDRSLGEHLGVQTRPLETMVTISVTNPRAIMTLTGAAGRDGVVKLKLAGEDEDLKRVDAAVNTHLGPIVLDANEALSVDLYLELVERFADTNVALIEQPFPEHNDSGLRDLPRPIPVCADESCHDRASLERLVGLYDCVNLKLDKTGGLTEALLTKARARELGFQIMVGCMVSTSLSIRPAFLLAQDAEFVDLDGALLLERDREDAMPHDWNTIWI